MWTQFGPGQLGVVVAGVCENGPTHAPVRPAAARSRCAKERGRAAKKQGLCCGLDKIGELVCGQSCSQCSWPEVVGDQASTLALRQCAANNKSL